MRKLNTFVHAVEINDDGTQGRSQVFGPADVLPDWARKSITNPKVWDGEDDEPETAELVEPPRKGPGSNREAWVTYAKEAHGIDVEDGATRDDVIAAIAEKG